VIRNVQNRGGSVLANSSLKPSLLCRHLDTRHPTQMNKPVDFFKRKLVESKSCIVNFASTTSNTNENALEASYRISYRVAKSFGSSHDIRESNRSMHKSRSSVHVR
jgi:hypothetical protein